MNLQSSYKNATLAAGRELTVEVTGSSFEIESSTGRAAMRLDDGSFFEIKSGTFANLPPGEYFKRITFKSLIGAGGGSITIKYYAGTMAVGNRTPSVYIRPVPTYTVVNSYPSGSPLASATSVTVPTTHQRTGDLLPNRLLRVRIESMVNNIIYVYQQPDDLLVAEIYPSQAWKEYDFPVRVSGNTNPLNMAIIAYYELPNA
jgi:hypothetical protein